MAPQALLLMNNAMVLFQARKFAERVRREAGDDPGAQVDARRSGSRSAARPIAVERQKRRSRASVEAATPDGLAEFCHVLFNLNEFVYRP